MKRPAPATTATDTRPIYHWAARRLAGYRNLVIDIGAGTGDGSTILQNSGLKVLAIDRAQSAVDACDDRGLLAYYMSFGANSEPFQKYHAALLIDVLEENTAPGGVVNRLKVSADCIIFTVPPHADWLTKEYTLHRLPAFPRLVVAEWRSASFCIPEK